MFGFSVLVLTLVLDFVDVGVVAVAWFVWFDGAIVVIIVWFTSWLVAVCLCFGLLFNSVGILRRYLSLRCACVLICIGICLVCFNGLLLVWDCV